MGGGRQGKGRGGKGTSAGGKGKGQPAGGRGAGTPQSGAGARPFVKGMPKTPTWTCKGCGQEEVWRSRTCCPHCGEAPPKAILKEQANAVEGKASGSAQRLQQEIDGLKKALKDALQASPGSEPAESSDEEGSVGSQKVTAAAYKKAGLRLARLKELAKDTPGSTHAQGWVADAEAEVAAARLRMNAAIPQEQRLAKLHATLATKSGHASREKNLLQGLKEERSDLDRRIQEQEEATAEREKEVALLSAELHELSLGPSHAGASQAEEQALSAACRNEGLEEHEGFILELVRKAVRGALRPTACRAEAIRAPTVQGNVFTFKDGDNSVLEMEMGVPQSAATVEDIQQALTQWQEVQSRIGRARGGAEGTAEAEEPGADSTDAQSLPALEDQASAAWTTVLKGMSKSLRPRVLYTPY